MAARLSLVASSAPPPPALVCPPAPPEPVYVCCHCKRPVTAYRFACDGHPVGTFHCQHCGDTMAMLSAGVNRY